MNAPLINWCLRAPLTSLGVPATGVLVETLLERGTEDDVCQAESAFDRLVAMPADHEYVVRDIWLLRMRAFSGLRQGDDDTYRDHRDRYRKMANELGFEGHAVGRGDAVTAVLPSGVVTFLFTDIEGSTRRWEADPEAMRAALSTHDEVLRPAIEARGGFCSSTPAMGVRGVHPHPERRWMQRSKLSGHWNCRCGMGISTGEAELRGSDYFWSCAQPGGFGRWQPDMAVKSCSTA